MTEAERRGLLTLSQGDSSRLSPLAQSSLFIPNLAVVNDLSRTNPDPCLAVPADAAKKWNLGHLLAQASIQFRSTGRCLELPNTNDLTRVEQKARGDVFQQYFYLVE